MNAQLKTMIDNMPEKTGKSLREWQKILAKQTFEKHMQAVKFLKTEYGVSHGFANTIVKLSQDDSAEQDPVAEQYKGKESLKPIYDKLIATVKKFGDDVEIAPKKSSVSLRRKRQFALIQPSTKTRIDLGLKFDDRAIEARLEGSGPFGTMCTHRVQLTDPAQVDEELISIIKDAYLEAE